MENENNVMKGNFVGPLLPSKPRIIRIYLSSVGPDSMEERKVLMEEVVPKLRHSCKNKFSVDFEWIDLKWGMDDDVEEDDHSLAELRAHIIEECFRTPSSGPFFVSILGQRYGNVLPPATIERHEFERMLEALQRNPGRTTRNWPLISTSYFRDENINPETYRLRNISQIKSIDGRTWSDIYKEITRLLIKAYDYLYKNDTFNDLSNCRYTMSEQENDIRKALKLSRGHGTICIQRDIIDLKNYLEDPAAPTFIEVTNNPTTEKTETDDQAESMRHELRTLSQNMCSDRPGSILKFAVLWRYDGVINPDHHRNYLREFAAKVHDKFVSDIESRLAVNNTIPPVSTSPVLEMRHHWIRCQILSSQSVGMTTELARIKEYLSDSSDGPLMVHGETGVGKTTLLSTAAVNMKSSNTEGYWIVVRLIGLTPASTDVYQLLRSLCYQLSCLEGTVVSQTCNMVDLIQGFNELMKKVPKSIKLVMILDGLDEACAADDDFQWIPKSLPKNVKLILSTHSQKHGLLARLEENIASQRCLAVERLTSSESERLLKTLLMRKSRQITAQQTDDLRPLIEKGNPLLIDLLSNVCCEWSHEVDCVKLNLGHSRDALMTYIFNKVENKFGKTLVQHSMACLVASSRGLSDNEMLDVLSLDDKVLNDVFKKRRPQIFRLPPAKWLYLKYAVRYLLFQYELDNTTIYNFKHSYYRDYIANRYLDNAERKQHTYALLSDYFLGKWNAAEKPILLENINELQWPNFQKARRHVAAQPMVFQENEASFHYNQRKLSQLPRCLFLSSNIYKLKKLVLFNYKWIYNKARAQSLQSVIKDIQLVKSDETLLLTETLVASRDIIERNVNTIATEIVGSLLPYYSKFDNIRSLIEQCQRDGLAQNATIPTYPYSSIPGTICEKTITFEKAKDLNSFCRTKRFVLAKDVEGSRVYKFDLITGEIASEIRASCGRILATPDGMFLILIDHVMERTIKVHMGDSGKYVGQLIVLNYITVASKDKIRLKDVIVSYDRLCLVMSSVSSYLCIADIPTCRFLQIVELLNRSDLCVFSSNSALVHCNSANHLLTYNAYSLNHVATTTLAQRPRIVRASRDDSRLFIVTEGENKISILHVYEGRTELAYKIVLSEILLNDFITDMIMSNGDQFLLIRGEHNLIIYDRLAADVLTTISRPKELPMEFKLPHDIYTTIVFRAAVFSRDDLYVIGAIFRHVYVWDMKTGTKVSVIHTPIGFVDELFVDPRIPRITTHYTGSNALQMWSIGKACDRSNTSDRMTNSVNGLCISTNNDLSFASCTDSDEIAVVDMKTGTFVDLLTQDGRVDNFAASRSGAFVAISLKSEKPNTSFKIWNLRRRTVVKECGNSPGICIPLNMCDGFVIVMQNKHLFNAPYYVTQFRLTNESVKECTCEDTVAHIIKHPNITSDDSYLIILSANGYDRRTNVYLESCVVVIDLKANKCKRVITKESLKGLVTVSDILDVHFSPRYHNQIGLLYTINSEDNPKSIGACGLVLLKLEDATVMIRHEPLVSAFHQDLIFSDDFTFCIDKMSTIHEIENNNQTMLNVLPGMKPIALVRDDGAILYVKGSHFFVLRILDNELIATVDVRSQITAITLSQDKKIVVIGCGNGRVLSYTIIDPEYDEVDEIVGKLNYRCNATQRNEKSWDKVGDKFRQYVRPPSSKGFDDFERSKSDAALSGFDPVERPISDIGSLNRRSKTCIVM